METRKLEHFCIASLGRYIIVTEQCEFSFTILVACGKKTVLDDVMFVSCAVFSM